MFGFGVFTFLVCLLLLMFPVFEEHFWDRCTTGSAVKCRRFKWLEPFLAVVIAVDEREVNNKQV